MNSKGSMSVNELVRFYDLTDEETGFILMMAKGFSERGGRKYDLLEAVRELLWSME